MVKKSIKFKKYLIILPIIITIFIIFFYKKLFLKTIENFSELFYPKQNDTLLCYQTLYDITKLFELHNIEYYVSFGTLLGAVRNKGMIPWDDDIDVNIPEKYEQNLLSDSFKKSLQKNGYDINKVHWDDGFYKIFNTNGTTRKNTEVKFPFLDVFITENKDDKISVQVANKTMKHLQKCYFLKNEIYPLKKFKFGVFEVYGPNKPESFLNRCYDDDWNDVKYQEYNHYNEENIEKIKTKLTDEDRKPAMPMEPIKF